MGHFDTHTLDHPGGNFLRTMLQTENLCVEYSLLTPLFLQESDLYHSLKVLLVYSRSYPFFIDVSSNKCLAYVIGLGVFFG